MTAEEKKQLKELQETVKQLAEFMKEKKSQQISFPLDLPSINNIATGLQSKGYVII